MIKPIQTTEIISIGIDGSHSTYSIMIALMSRRAIIIIIIAKLLDQSIIMFDSWEQLEVSALGRLKESERKISKRSG